MKRSRSVDEYQHTHSHSIAKIESHIHNFPKPNLPSAKETEKKMADGRESFDGIIDTAIASVHNNPPCTPGNNHRRFIPCLTPIQFPKELQVSISPSPHLLDQYQLHIPRLPCDSFDQFSSSAISQQSSPHTHSPERDSFAKVGAEIDHILSPVSDCPLQSSPTKIQGMQTISKLLSIPVCETEEIRQKPEVSSTPHGKGRAMQEILQAMATPASQTMRTGRRRSSSTSTQCHLCGKTYTESSNLSKHIRTVHLKLRPFQCTQCSSSFAEKNKLRKHIQSVHEHARPYKCESCSATFSQASDRKRHRLVLHEGCRPFSCEQCGKAFGRRSSLTQHCHRVHKRIKVEVVGQMSTSK